MHPQTPLHHTQSPPFGYLSPSDAFSDDGDSLQTPLTEHQDSPHHSCAVYGQNQDPFAHPSFHSYCGHQPSSAFPDSTKSELEQSSLSSFSALLTPSASDKLARSNHHTTDEFFSFSSPPSNALDLANDSLEFNPFCASFGITTEITPLLAPRNNALTRLVIHYLIQHIRSQGPHRTTFLRLLLSQIP